MKMNEGVFARCVRKLSKGAPCSVLSKCAVEKKSLFAGRECHSSLSTTLNSRSPPSYAIACSLESIAEIVAGYSFKLSGL